MGIRHITPDLVMEISSPHMGQAWRRGKSAASGCQLRCSDFRTEMVWIPALQLALTLTLPGVADLPTIFACMLGPRVQNTWKMYPMLGIARRILSSRAFNQFVGFINFKAAYHANLTCL